MRLIVLPVVNGSLNLEIFMRSVLAGFLFATVIPALGMSQDAIQPEISIKTASLTQEGHLVGTISTALSSFAAISPAEGLTVTLSRKGMVMGKAQTGREGTFVMENVKPGRYSLVAAGKTALLATGIDIVAVSKDAPAKDVDGLTMVAMPSPYDMAKSILSRFKKRIAAGNPVKQTPIQLISTRVTTPSVTEGTIQGQVADLNGALVGKATVVLVQGDKVVVQTQVQHGVYTFDNVKPGIYSLMAVSDGGFSVFGLEVLKGSITRKVSFEKASPTDITLVDGKTILLITTQDDEEEKNTEDEEEDEDEIIIPFFPGSGPAGGGGLGGGGGGLGGLGAVAGVAGLTAGVAALSASPK